MEIDLYNISDLGFCFLCPLDSGLEEHHIVPQCYGGKDGPTVTLCGVCHTNVHALADKWGTSPALTALALSEVWNHTKALVLAKVIRRSKEAVKNDPNKTARFSTKFSGEMLRKIRRLKTVLPVTNQEQVIKYAIDALYTRYYRE